jgi:hypothetical protein
LTIISLPGKLPVILCGDNPLAHLEPNPSAEKTLGVLAKLIESGRYANSTTPIARLLDDVGKIKAKIEDIYSDKS